MYLKEIDKKTFDEYSKKQAQGSFLQSAPQADMYESNPLLEYKIYALYNQNDEIVFAGLYNIYRSARLFKAAACFFGPVGDYRNFDDYREYHKLTMQALKKEGVYKVRIFPRIIAQERDIDGTIVAKGENNLHLVEAFTQLGYHHYGFNQGNEDRIARFLFIKDIEGIETEKELLQSFPHKGTTYAVKRTMVDHVQVRELEYEELHILYEILKKIHIKKNASIVSIEELQQIYKIHKPYHTAKFMVAEIDVEAYEQRVTASIIEQEKLIAEIDQFLATGKESKKKENRKQEALAILKKDQERLLHIANYKKHAVDGKLPLASGLFYKYGSEMSNFIGGNDEDYPELYGNYALHWEMLKSAVSDPNIKTYNFFATFGSYSGADGGIHRFKSGFGGNVVEYLGAFDYPINKPLFKLFTLFKGRS